MSWIVIGEEKGKIKLVSKSNVSGLLPKGSYLTIEDKTTKFILRIDESYQSESYAPSPLIIDMDLSPLKQDQKCQNVVLAHRVKDLSDRTDGFVDYIKPQSLARKSTQAEIIDALGGIKNNGPPVFIATVYAGENQVLRDESGKFIQARLPEDMFYHQMLICGKTGSGKTVATKYLAQYFVEKMDGAVLAVNVKEKDFLNMDQPSKTINKNVIEEWQGLDQKPHGVKNCTIYYPSTAQFNFSGVSKEISKKITLDVKKIEPEALNGLIQGISDIGAQYLPDIFRFWKEKKAKGEKIKFNDFVKYFQEVGADKREFDTLNVRGNEGVLPLHKGTYDNILRNLNQSIAFFDDDEAESIDESDILEKGKISVINVATGKNGLLFGSILLRDLLHRIVMAKSQQQSDIPILIIIDEVHIFYDSNASMEALGDLDTICRTGRSQQIGVIFSSQNPTDIPTGLSTVINTKIFFKSDPISLKSHGIHANFDEMESLKKGYAFASIYDLSQLKILKFPMSFAGVLERSK